MKPLARITQRYNNAVRAAFCLGAASMVQGSDLVTILPLGDSITEGFSTDTYRSHLYQSLDALGIRVDYQGTRFGVFSSGDTDDYNFDLNHEAVSGIRIDGVLTNLASNLALTDADKVLLHLGTNDLLNGDTPENAVDEIRQVIETLRADNPAVVIFLAQIIPADAPFTAENNNITTFNTLLAALAAELHAPATPVILVDQNTGLNFATDYADPIHPNAIGDQKMAANWEAAILAYDALEGPSAITAPFAYSEDDDTIILTWQPGSDNLAVASYEISRDGQLIATTNNSFFVDDALSAGTSYNYTITALDASSNASSAVAISATTLSSGQSAPPAALRINAGGSQYTDSNGQIWLAERGFSGGTSSSVPSPISGTDDDILYQSDRFGDYTFTDSVPAGDYLLIFHFAETFADVGGPGERLFDLVISQDGTTLAEEINYDIRRDASSNNEATQLYIPLSLTSSAFDISTFGNTEQAKICAYELRPVTNLPDQIAPTEPSLTSSEVFTNGNFLGWSAASDNVAIVAYEVYRNGTLLTTTTDLTFLDSQSLAPGQYLYQVYALDAEGNRSSAASALLQVGGTTGVAIRINVGGEEYLDSNGFTWEADYGFVGSGGNAGIVTTSEINATIDDFLYQSERFAPNFSYSIPVTPGEYIVRLHFAEVYSGAFTNGGRVFDIFVEGNLVANNYDIFAEVGAETATVVSTELTVLDGNLNIDLPQEIQNPKLSAIEIISTEPTNTAGPASPEFVISHAAEPTAVYLNWENSADGIPASSFELSRDGNLLGVINGFEYFDFGASASTAHTYELVAILDGESSSPATALVNTPAQALTSVLRINAGGDQYVDALGQLWEADYGSNGGTGRNPGGTFTSSQPIANTAEDYIYQSERFKQNLSYAISLANGSYVLRLHFAEVYDRITSAGQRVFDVEVEGTQVLDNYDIFALVGLEAATTVDIPFDLLDGTLNIDFDQVVQNPKVAGIEVLVADDTILRVNSGGFEPYFSADNKIWLADFGFGTTGTGNAGQVTTNTISGTDDQYIFQNERFNTDLQYTFPVPSGNYTVKLLLTEVYDGAFTNGARVFSVAAEGQVALPAVDIFAAVGAETAYEVSFPVTVSDDELNLNFGQISQNPKVNALEIIADTGSTPGTPVITSVGLTGLNEVTLTWETVIGADTYRVSRNGTELTTTAATMFTDFNAMDGETYLYEVVAIKTGGAESAPETIEFTVPDIASQQSIRINTGGPEYLDNNGLLWSADFGFSGSGGGAGSISSQPIANTEDDFLYQSERFSSDLSYSIPITNGDYLVSIHLAEVYFGTFRDGTRVFSATAEGETVFGPTNILTTVGPNAALVESTTVTVTDGVLDIDFNPIIENPKVSAIEIIPTTVVNSITAPSIDFATSPDPNSVVLEWSPEGLVPAVEYQVLRNSVLITTQSETEFIDTGLSADTDYLYEIIAVDAESNLSPASSVQLRTPLLEFESFVRINVGGPDYTDQLGRLWSADFGFNNGIDAVVTSNPIANTNDDELYQSERFASNLSYSVPVPDGTYELDLHFAEVYFGVFRDGTRIFNVAVEGSVVDTGVNIAAAVGSDAALILTYPVTVTDGVLDFNLPPVVQNAKLSAIEILAPSSSVVRTNSGGPAYYDSQGRVWTPDFGFQNGIAALPVTNNIANTEDDALYQTERFGDPLDYAFTLPNGSYTVDLHFAETNFTSIGARVFDINIEGAGVIFGEDIFEMAGANSAYVESIPVVVTDGVLNINCNATTNNAKISAIEVKQN